MRPRALPERITIMSKYSNPDLQGWHRNTELCVDLKTVLRTDFIAGFGKQYPGQLTRDKEDHFSFIRSAILTLSRYSLMPEPLYPHLAADHVLEGIQE